MCSAADAHLICAFVLDDRTVRVPPDWARRFQLARAEDLRATTWFLGVAMVPWAARYRVDAEFIAAVAAGLEVVDL